jgi:uncharacterized protein (TIGR00730 family)
VIELRRVCVFCGSSLGRRPEYLEGARGFGELLASQGVGLVYGGAKVGVMGALADGALAAGGEAIGVIPTFMTGREVAHEGLTELHVVDSMHERKALMAELADAFVSLPGGLGTLEETFEVLSWSQLGLHRKPVGLLDVAGYFGPLEAFLDHAVAEGFVLPEHRRLVLSHTDPASLLARLRAFEPPPTRAWLRAVEAT